MPEKDQSDILVLGCGIAGAAAAVLVAQQGRAIRILEQATAHDPAPKPEWLHAEGVGILEAAGVDVAKVMLGKIERIRFLDASSARTAEGALDTPITVVDSAKVKAALAAAAMSAGAKILTGVVARRLNAREDAVEVIDAKGEVHRGLLLLLGDGVQTLGRTLPAIARSDESPRLTTKCDWVGPAGASSESKRRGSELVIRLSALEPENYGYRLAAGSLQSVGWISNSSGDKARRGLAESARKLASPAVIRAMRDRQNEKPATAEVRALLGAAPDEPIRYRRVRLMCGPHVLSEADNWYRAGALTPAMNKTLDETDTPFGTVVRPLNFTRRTLDAGPGGEPGTVLRVRAVLLAGASPFSLVVENYRPALVAPPGR